MTMTTKIIGPKKGQVEHRLMKTTSAAPLSYDKGSHSVDCVLSKGAADDRFFGAENC
jgi:hypothetical protein